MIRSTEDYWVRDSRFISLSDLGLIAKEGQDKIYVFTNSIKLLNRIEWSEYSCLCNQQSIDRNRCYQ